MKCFLSVMMVLLLSLGVVACGDSPDGYDMNGRPISLKAFRGKWVFVNYWAEWCEACLAEIPELNAFYRSHAGDVVVLGVSYDAWSKQQIRSFAAAHGVDYPMLDFLRLEAPEEMINVLPATKVFKPDGQLGGTLFGPQSRLALEKLIHN